MRTLHLSIIHPLYDYWLLINPSFAALHGQGHDAGLGGAIVGVYS